MATNQNLSKDTIVAKLDNQCRELLHEVEQHVMIDMELRDDENKSYDYQTLKRNADGKPTYGRIRYYEPIESCKIAHELLHAKCSYLLGYDKHIFEFAQNLSNPSTSKLLDYQMCQSISTQAEHYIFYKAYIAMGYESEKFVEKIDFDKQGWDDFTRRFQKANVTYSDARNLLTCFHHLMLFPNDNRFAVEIQQLKHLDRDLYTAFKTFRNALPDIMTLEQDQIFQMEPLYDELLTAINFWCKRYMK